MHPFLSASRSRLIQWSNIEKDRNRLGTFKSAETDWGPSTETTIDRTPSSNYIYDLLENDQDLLSGGVIFSLQFVCVSVCLFV